MSGYLSSASARGERVLCAVAGRASFARCAPGGELNLLFIAQNARFVNVCAVGAHGTKLFILWRTICARMVRANRERTKNNSESPHKRGFFREEQKGRAPCIVGASALRLLGRWSGCAWQLPARGGLVCLWKIKGVSVLFSKAFLSCVSMLYNCNMLVWLGAGDNSAPAPLLLYILMFVNGRVVFSLKISTLYH